MPGAHARLQGQHPCLQACRGKEHAAASISRSPAYRHHGKEAKTNKGSKNVTVPHLAIGLRPAVVHIQLCPAAQRW